jgi:hypothetical protein
MRSLLAKQPENERIFLSKELEQSSPNLPGREEYCHLPLSPVRYCENGYTTESNLHIQ